MRAPLKPGANGYAFLSVSAMILGLAMVVVGLAGGPPYLSLGFSGVICAAGIGWAYAARVSSARAQ